MKNKRLNHFDNVVEWVANRYSLFGIDEIKTTAEAFGYESPDHPSDWSRILRGSVSRNIIEPTEIYKRSRLKTANGIPRMLYRKRKKLRGGVVNEK